MGGQHKFDLKEIAWLSYYMAIFKRSEILTKKRLVGKPRSRWVGNINSILKKLLGCGGELIYLVQNTGPVPGSYINGYESKGLYRMSNSETSR